MQVNKELKIDKEFKELIAPLSDDEFSQLKLNILSDGCRDPIVVWNGIIVDGHNRYRICTENNIPFKTISMNFTDRSEVIMWMLKNQLGRRNLNDFQRNELALKYQDVIAKKMKERQATSTGGKNPQLMTKWSEAEKRPEPTTQRKELAQIAKTSEGSIQRSKLILEHGTPEQIERARQGGTGNTISAIAKEISKKEAPKDIRKMKLSEVTGDLNDTEKVIERDMSTFSEEFEVNFDTYYSYLLDILEKYRELLSSKDNKKQLKAILKKCSKRMEEMEGDFNYEEQL